MESRSLKSGKTALFSTMAKTLDLLIAFVTRTLFIRIFGVGLLGVSGLFTNVISILSLADLGFGTAMTYSYYKPIADNDYEKIAQLAKESPCPELERVEYGQMFERSMKYIYPYYWNKTNQPELLAMLKEYLKKYKSEFFSTSTHSWRYNSLARVAAISTRAYYYLMRIIRKLTDED